jgi:hypothetical protein
MKLKLKKDKDGNWMAGIYHGKGGISSLINARHSKSFWSVISVFFKLRNWENLKRN